MKHNPERLQDETQEQYRARRRSLQRETRRILAGSYVRHVGNDRTRNVKAAGGIRQFKRQQYLRKYEGYAHKHPGVAAPARG